MIKFITDKMLKYIILSLINFIMSCDLGYGSKVDVRCQNTWLQECLPTLLYWIGGLNFFSLKLKF